MSSFSFIRLPPVVVFLFFTACQVSEKERSSLDILQKDVAFLAQDSLEGREIGSRGELQAGVYIVERFRSAGLIPYGSNGYYQPFKVSPGLSPHERPRNNAKAKNDSTAIQGNNVIGRIDNNEEKIIVIGAHYDHLGYGGPESLHRGDTAVHNGADDNASGVAVLIWLAHKLAQQKLSKDLVFIAFSGEEKGLWGSNYFCKNSTIDLSKVVAMINLDMVGRLDEQKGLAIHGIGTSPSWEKIIQEANTDSLSLILRSSGVGPSDHTSFYLQNIPVLHFFTGQHADYHKPTDDADKINYQGMEKIAGLVERVVFDLDKHKELVFTKTKDTSKETPRFSVVLGVVPDYLFDGQGMRIDGISEGGAAQKAKLQKGDVVIAMGDVDVADMNSYMKALSTFKKGDKTMLSVLRDGKKMNFSITF